MNQVHFTPILGDRKDGSKPKARSKKPSLSGDEGLRNALKTKRETRPINARYNNDEAGNMERVNHR
jgi:hypothetical protein